MHRLAYPVTCVNVALRRLAAARLLPTVPTASGHRRPRYQLTHRMKRGVAPVAGLALANHWRADHHMDHTSMTSAWVPGPACRTTPAKPP
jgi:hypothetical protein